MPDMDRSGRLELPYILPSQAQKHVTHNEAVQMLDAIVQLGIAGFDLSAPPAAPQDGDVYAIGAAPTGAWFGQAGKLAYWNASGWLFLAPHEGWMAHDRTGGGFVRRQAGAWQPLLQGVDGIGIATSWDAGNRLAVASPATLLTHSGTDHRLKVNKATPADTASLVFQSGWSGRAEMGLAGDDAFSVKVSADGTGFTTALSLNPASGLATGAAIAQSSVDTTAGRLLRVGAGPAQLDPALYHQGNVVGSVGQVAGLPTGAVIESGSNANGSYIRYADGTQICFRRAQLVAISINTASGSMFRGNVGNFDFPAAFSQVVAVSGTVMGSQNATIRNSAGFLKTRQGSSVAEADWVGVTLWSSSSVTGVAGEVTQLSLMAFGRWF